MRIIALVLSCFAAFPAFSATITFSGPHGTIVAPTAEGIFTYSVFSGGIFRQSICCGNPLPHVEGDTFQSNPGVLSFVRNDVIGGLFTFAAADVAVFAFDGTNILAQGYLLGVLQASDALAALNGDDNWVTRPAVNLAGVSIDELRITLDVGDQGEFEELDNVVLNPITTASTPEPATALMLFGGLAAVLAFRRRRAAIHN